MTNASRASVASMARYWSLECFPDLNAADSLSLAFTLERAAELLEVESGDLDAYARTIKRIEEVDARVVAVLQWLDERGRNSRSFGSHADAYEIAARKLREALQPDVAAPAAHSPVIDGDKSRDAHPLNPSETNHG